MKIKIFSNCNLEKLTNQVNSFISTVNVIDIKMSGYSDATDILVIYDEKGAK